jgi:hypothetical protein
MSIAQAERRTYLNVADDAASEQPLGDQGAVRVNPVVAELFLSGANLSIHTHSDANEGLCVHHLGGV